MINIINRIATRFRKHKEMGELEKKAAEWRTYRDHCARMSSHAAARGHEQERQNYMFHALEADKYACNIDKQIQELHSL